MTTWLTTSFPPSSRPGRAGRRVQGSEDIPGFLAHHSIDLLSVSKKLKSEMHRFGLHTMGPVAPHEQAPAGGPVWARRAHGTGSLPSSETGWMRTLPTAPVEDVTLTPSGFIGKSGMQVRSISTSLSRYIGCSIGSG